MKREIKFRGKRLDSMEWVYGSLVGIDDTYVIVDYRDFSWNPHTDVNAFWFDMENNEVDPNTVGQYTGLKDKNGVEICEDDIISARGIILTVKYIGGVFFACNVDSNTDKYPLYILCEWENESGCEIIGNIHDNPELLKK